MSGDTKKKSKPDHDVAAQVLELMRAGYSLSAAAGALGVWRQRIYEWAENDPELADTIRIGQAARTFKLEGDLLSAENGHTVTSRIFALKNSAPEEWRDRVITEMTGADGGPIKTEEQGTGAARLAAVLDSIAERSGTSGGSGA